MHFIFYLNVSLWCLNQEMILKQYDYAIQWNQLNNQRQKIDNTGVNNQAGF